LIELEKDNLGELLKENGQVIVQFGASWCGNCRMLKPRFKKLSNEHENIKFIYADAENFPGSREFANVDNLPTFATYKNGKLVSQMQSNKVDKIEELINAIANN